MDKTQVNDVERLKTEYADRAIRLHGSDRYSPFNIAHFFMLQQRQRATLDMLVNQNFSTLSGKLMLEVGCGAGTVLNEYLGFRAELSHMHGTDLLPARLTAAKNQLPQLSLSCADGQQLPYRSNTFDLVLQYTVFSSILDTNVMANIAQEMLRVIRKPGGLIIWYDFWLNPTNRQTRGIRPQEIRQLFPNCQYAFRRVTLAPPIARRLVPISWITSVILEKISLFNTHYLVIIKPQ
jgi:ubiquinone/menaquinone biosynthesis C-methylase UbiE